MNRQEIIWAIEVHALNARKISDAGDDPCRELARINALIEEYLAKDDRNTADAKRRPSVRPWPVAKAQPMLPGETAIPYRYDIMPHTLAVLADGRVRDSDSLREEVADRMGLSREQRLALRPGSTSLIPEFANEHAWGLVYLQNPRYTRASDALILNVDPDGDPESYQITEEGVAAHKAGMTFESKRSSRRAARTQP